MNSLTESYLTRAETWLFITTLAYFLMNGAQVFETAVMVPKWTANPPLSLSMLADKNGLSLKTFWIILHSIHEITFILAIVFCWKLDPVRNWLLVLFGLHFVVRVWTLAYFAPNIIEFEKLAAVPGSAPGLQDKVNTWKMLNYLRVGIYLVLSFALIPLCIRMLNWVRG